MAWVELAYSKSQVKRAGKLLRDSVRHPLTINEQTVHDAELVLENWRSATTTSRYPDPPGTGPTT